VLAALSQVLENRRPGPKPAVVVTAPPAPAQEAGRPTQCPVCQSQHIWKNGAYLVLHWLATLCLGWCGVQWRRIQRWRCAECHCEIPAPERTAQAQARQAWRQQVKRLVARTWELTAEEISRTVHAHPTLSEALMEAAHVVSGQAIHV